MDARQRRRRRRAHGVRPRQRRRQGTAWPSGLKAAHPRVGGGSLRLHAQDDVHRPQDGRRTVVQFTKGAPDEVLSLYQAMRTARSSHDRGASEQILPPTRPWPTGRCASSPARSDLDASPANCTPQTWSRTSPSCGLSGMIDPVRPEVAPAIEECRSAGIRPVMITGDHMDTAVAIATRARHPHRRLPGHHRRRARRDERRGA